MTTKSDSKSTTAKSKGNTSEGICKGCQITFPSRNAVFRHLLETNGGCLSSEDLEDFLQYVQQRERKKTLVLYGYIPNSIIRQSSGLSSPSLAQEKHITASAAGWNIENGDDAARILLKLLSCEDQKINRSYGCQSRGSAIAAQDDSTGALTEVLCLKLPPMPKNAVAEWMDELNAKLDAKGVSLRVLGRLDMPFGKFNAEMDVSHRRVEYLLPADFLFETKLHSCHDREDFFRQLHSFSGAIDRQNRTAKDAAEVNPACTTPTRPSSDMLQFLYNLKKTMQLLTTQVVEIQNNAELQREKDANKDKRRRQKKCRGQHNRKQQKIDENADKHENKSMTGPSVVPNETKADSKKGKNVLRRRRFHNFTPRAMAHEFLVSRRLDRFYHRGTVRFESIGDRPFLVLSLTGDTFLQGQAVRVVGLLVALIRNLIDADFVDCVFDEEYPHLVPTPPVPAFAMYYGESNYANWEGKTKQILSPRFSDRYPSGWNSNETLQAVADWQERIQEAVALAWMQQGVTEDGRLVAEQHWAQQTLEPWAERAHQQLKEYRQWKQSQRSVSNKTDKEGRTEPLLPALLSVDSTVPSMFQNVLSLLRKTDASGLWPSSSPKRQMVIMSTGNSLAMAQRKVKANCTDRSSAYDTVEGEGGASGSFSVGAMPGEMCTHQPKANALFPELMKAAFELEMALCPSREPSSTIAINRNAQFRPHTDQGAGAGQSTSLIVGLGTYAGGELVVEGEKKDIRYKAIEFNGWTQRHWTMPFHGERYSLVWFTPKGCEGIRGIDLC